MLLACFVYAYKKTTFFSPLNYIYFLWNILIYCSNGSMFLAQFLSR